MNAHVKCLQRGMIFCLRMQSTTWTSKRSKGQWLQMNKWLCSFPKEASVILDEWGLARTIPTNSFTLGAHGVRKYTHGLCPGGQVIQDGECPSWLSVVMTNTVTKSNSGKRGFILAYMSRNRLLLREIKSRIQGKSLEQRPWRQHYLLACFQAHVQRLFLYSWGPHA